MDLDDLRRDKWVEIVPESSAVLEDFAVIGAHIAGLYLENVHSSVRVFTAEGKRLSDVPTPSIGTVAALQGTWSNPEAFLQFTSFNVPTTVYRFDIRNPQLTVFHRLNVPFNGEDLEVKQVWVESKDKKTKVPMERGRDVFHRVEYWQEVRAVLGRSDEWTVGIHRWISFIACD